MNNIECEVRCLISEDEYETLLGQFKDVAVFEGADEQVTYYFDSKEDLRIQKNEHFAKVWLKKGALHDDHREEIEIKVPKDDFEKLEQLFLALGFNIAIKWFRTRNSFKWGDIDVALDHTKGYGHILELEKLTNEEEKESTVHYLKSRLTQLGLEQTPKETFDQKYQYYKDHWQEIM